MDGVIDYFRKCSVGESLDSSFVDFSEEEEIADELSNKVRMIYSVSFDSEGEKNTLDYGSDDKSDERGELGEDMEHDTNYDENEFDTINMESFSLSYMKEVLDYYDVISPRTGRRAHSWRNVQHRFKRVKHQSYIRRFRHYVDQGGTEKEKLLILEDEVHSHFAHARDNFCPVHDIDIKRWAIRAARRIEFSGFTASDGWILKFKRKNGICSRKITKVAEWISSEFCELI